MLNNLNFSKMKTMKFDDIISVQRCEYIYLQLIPTKSNRNNNTEQIAHMINKLVNQSEKFIKRENKKLIINEKPKISFYIHISKDKVQFYFIVPKIHGNKFKIKFTEVWKHIEIKEVTTLPEEPNSCSKFDLHYLYDDSLSLALDKRSNDLLNANMSIVDALTAGESVGILYNFIPTSQKQTEYFHRKYVDILRKYEKGENLKKNKNITDYTIISLQYILDFINIVQKSILSNSKKTNDTLVSNRKETSNSTKRKAKNAICNTQIVLLTKSSTKERENELGTTLYNTYKSIDDDNKLILSEITKEIDIKRTIIKNCTVNKMSVEENENFISMPSTDIIKQFGMIEHNKVLQLKAPKCLETGEIRVGTLKDNGNNKQIYYSIDEQIKRMSRVLIGSQGAGKDYYMVNLAKNIIEAGRGLIVIDYIDKCQLADNIKAITPQNRLVEINCNDDTQLQSFLYNELKYRDTDTINTKIEIAMQKAQQFELLLDSINDVGSALTPRMLRFLYCAGTVSFYNNQNSSFKDVINILKYPDKRVELIESIDEAGRSILDEEIEDLKELNKNTKSGVIENADSKIEGVLDRISKIKSASLYSKLAYTNDATNNIDFVEAMNEKKVILIKIPHKSFKTKMLKDLMCTFYLSKIWLAKQEADNSIQTEVFINELHQSPHSQLLLEDILVEHRKYNLTFTFAMHYLDQLTHKCKDSILASGASFLLICGCDKKAFNELSNYFSKDGYTETDLAELERYNALCLIKNEDENYSSFIVKLPS